MVKEGTNKKRRFQSILLGSGGLILAAIAGILLLPSWFTPSGQIYEIYCDAENVSGGKFKFGEYEFGNGGTRSMEKARSGMFSSKIHGKKRFGMSYHIKGAQGGEEYMISIWRYNVYGFGAIIVDADWGFYGQEGNSYQAEPTGWEEIRVRVKVPDTCKDAVIKTYAYYPYQFGTPVYFDDMNIWKVTPERNEGPAPINFEQFRDSVVTVDPEVAIRGMSVRAYLQGTSEGNSRLRIYSYFHTPVTLVGLSNTIGGKDISPITTRAIKEREENGTPTIFEGDVEGAGRFLVFSISGSDEYQFEEIIPWPEPEGLAPRQLLDRDSAAAIEPNDSIYTFTAGEHRLQHDLKIPAGLEVRFEPGCTLTLEAEADFISYSPVTAIGSSDAPILIRGSRRGDGSFNVLAKFGKTDLRYVEFRNLGNLSQNGWTLTGAVTINEGDVNLQNCKFIDNLCEDGLNLIRSTFTMADCELNGASSDGFDADFCTGKIRNSKFSNTINDGLDFSGSTIHIQDVHVNEAGDKGLSAGEASTITVDNLQIRNAVLGIASKDQSKVTGKDIVIDGCTIGYSAYQKKPEYGPAWMKIDGWKGSNQNVHEIGPGSILLLDGLEVRGN